MRFRDPQVILCGWTKGPHGGLGKNRTKKRAGQIIKGFEFSAKKGHFLPKALGESLKSFRLD